MPRKKKRRTTRSTATTRKRRRITTRKQKPVLELNLKSSVLRDIYGIAYLSVGVFTILSFYNSFGIVGEYWLEFIGPILGWGVYVFPFVLIAISLYYFLSKKIALAVSKLIGMVLMTLAVLSVLHLYVPMDAIYSSAQAGEYGGYVGFVTNFLFLEVFKMGALGSAVVFFIVFVVGILMTFEISIIDLVNFFKPSFDFVKINRVDDLEEVPRRKAQKELVEEDDELEDFDPREVIKHIEKMPDSDFGMPANYEDEPTIKIKRANISSDPEVSEDGKDDRTKQIPIKSEDEALTSGDGNIASDWKAPSLDLLSPAVPDIALDDEMLADNALKIQEKLQQFGIDVSMHDVHVGPTVIQYTLKPHEGIKLSKITTLKNDLALALAAHAIRIEAPIPGRGLVGIEVPNENRSVVHLREIMESKEYSELDSNLRFPLGRDVSGKPIVGDLGAMPHILIAGATGSGKSVGMNTFILSLLYQNSPADLRMILVDPKRVELTGYNGLPHLLTPVITDPEKAAIALRWAVSEMNRRYQLFAELGCRNIKDYNTLCAEKANKNGGGDLIEEAADMDLSDGQGFVQRVDDEEVQTSIEGQCGDLQKMPKIVIIIDELADLMMASGKEVEASICRIAQMARAVGLHLVIATQRPSVDVITGLIKANIPARIAFAVSSQVDSRTIIDGGGAEDLLGKGDMLYLPGGTSKLSRIQGIFVSSKEIERVVNNVKLHGDPVYHVDIVSPKVLKESVQGLPNSGINSDASDVDAMYEQALQVVMEQRKASASLLQRRLKIGYARAARLLDLMEDNGAIGPVNGAKPREIYVD